MNLLVYEEFPQIFLNIPYLHLTGLEVPLEPNTYLTLKKIPLESADKFKRHKSTTEFGQSEDMYEILEGCRERINPDQFDICIPEE